jgi:hypothetical protein
MEKVEKTERPPRPARRGGSGVLVWFIVIIAVIVVGLFWFNKLPVGSGFVSDNDAYQAVFLTNGQVYFGKLSRTNSQYPVLTNIYYLQVSQGLQPIDATVPQPGVSLVKLGDELHGPQDAMFINRDQILFYEDLKNDAQVVQAIKRFEDSREIQDN